MFENEYEDDPIIRAGFAYLAELEGCTVEEAEHRAMYGHGAYPGYLPHLAAGGQPQTQEGREEMEQTYMHHAMLRCLPGDDPDKRTEWPEGSLGALLARIRKTCRKFSDDPDILANYINRMTTIAENDDDLLVRAEVLAVLARWRR